MKLFALLFTDKDTGNTFYGLLLILMEKLLLFRTNFAAKGAVLALIISCYDLWF